MGKIGGGKHIFQNAAAVYLALNLALNISVFRKKKTPFLGNTLSFCGYI